MSGWVWLVLVNIVHTNQSWREDIWGYSQSKSSDIPNESSALWNPVIVLGDINDISIRHLSKHRMQLYARIRRGSFTFPDGSFGALLSGDHVKRSTENWGRHIFCHGNHLFESEEFRSSNGFWISPVTWGEIQKRLIKGVMRKDAAARCRTSIGTVYDIGV